MKQTAEHETKSKEQLINELVALRQGLAEMRQRVADLERPGAPRKWTEENFRELLETVPDATIISNEAGQLVLVNTQTEKLFGYTRQELLGQSVENLMPERFRSQHRQHRASYSFNPHIRPMGIDSKLYGLRQNGVEFPVEISLSPLESEEGNFVLSTIRDVTEREKAGEALRESEERFRKIFNHSNDAIFIIDPAQDEILDANPRAADMLEFSRRELLSLPVSAIHPQEMFKLLGFYRSVSEQGQGWTDELSCLTGTKKVLPVEISASVIELAGRSCLLALVRDISERKRAEEALRQSEALHRDLFEEAPLAYYSVGVDGSIKRANHRAAELLDWNREELIGRRVFDLYANTSAGKEMAEKIFQQFQDGQEIHEVELEMHKVSCRPVWISLTVRPVRDANGKVVESRSMVEDITACKQASEEIRRRSSHLEALNTVIAAAVNTPDIARLLEIALEHTLQALELKMGAICVADQQVFHELPAGVSQVVESLVQMSNLNSPDAIVVEDWQVLGSESLLGVVFPLMQHFGIRASLTAPILVKGEQVGWLSLASLTPRPWPAEEINLAKAVGRQLGGAVERLHLLEKTQKQARQLQQVIDTVPGGVILLNSERRTSHPTVW